MPEHAEGEIHCGAVRTTRSVLVVLPNPLGDEGLWLVLRPDAARRLAERLRRAAAEAEGAPGITLAPEASPDGAGWHEGRQA